MASHRSKVQLAPPLEYMVMLTLKSGIPDCIVSITNIVMMMYIQNRNDNGFLDFKAKMEQ